MSKSLINLGTTPNDRTGDTLRDAGSKVNSNVNELYTALGDGTALQVAVSGATSGQVLKFNGTAFVPATDLNTDAVTSVNTQTGNVVLTTTDVAEGDNLYYTDALARAAITASGALALDADTGVLTFTQGNSDTVAEGVNNLYYTAGRFEFTLSQKTTDDLTQGTTNKYFSNTLARGSISATGDLDYDNVTGVISYTAPTLFSGSYNDLTDTPTLFDGAYTSLTSIPAAFTTNKIATATAPTSATDTGTAGEVRYDADFIYVCVATDTWVRAALLTWI